MYATRNKIPYKSIVGQYTSVQILSPQCVLAQLSIRRILLHHTKHIDTNNYVTLRCMYYMRNRREERKRGTIQVEAT